MSTYPARAALLVALACAAAAPQRAAAQTTRERERIRVEKERADREADDRDRLARDRAARERADREERDREYDRELAARERERERERERALDRARETRERALREAREREDRLRESQLRAARERQARERQYAQERARRDAEVRRAVELQRSAALRRAQERQREERLRDLRRRYRDEWRPRVSLGGGIDMREFDGANDRYVVQGGVDFRSRSGLGMRPEVTYAWTDRGGTQAVVTGSGAQVGAISVGRNQALGVMLNATYTFFRGSMVRPYVLGGPGVLSTRIAPVQATGVVIQPGTPTQLPSTSARHELDLGLNAGAGLELSIGPVRLFTETRYFLTDSPAPRGFSGMVPITAGIRF